MDNVIKLDSGLEHFKVQFIDRNEIVDISFNPTDLSILTRYDEAKETYLKLIEELPKDLNLNNTGDVEEDSKYYKLVEDTNKALKDSINNIFGNNIADTIFQFGHPLSIDKNGVTFYERFINAILPVISERCEKAQKASEKRIEAHTNKYTAKKK